MGKGRARWPARKKTVVRLLYDEGGTRLTMILSSLGLTTTVNPLFACRSATKNTIFNKIKRVPKVRFNLLEFTAFYGRTAHDVISEYEAKIRK